MGPRLGAVFVLAVILLHFRFGAEAMVVNFTRKIQMHWPRHASFQMPEGVCGVLMDAIRRDQPLAVFLESFGGGLLIAGLNEVLAIVGSNGYVTRQHQQRRARAMGHCD